MLNGNLLKSRVSKIHVNQIRVNQRFGVLSWVCCLWMAWPKQTLWDLKESNQFFRYIAVHNPLDYNQSNNDPNAKKKRLAKYLFPVVIVSILFNIPKFFEAKYITTTEKVKSNNWYVFCYQNCSDPLWEKNVLVIEKNLFQGWRPRICKNFEITRTIYLIIQTVKGQNNFWLQNAFLNLFLDVSQI